MDQVNIRKQKMTIENSETILDSSESSSTKVFNSIRSLIRDKTRFEPEEVQLANDEAIQQSYSIQVNHEIEAVVTTEHITGFFKTQETCEKAKAENPTLTAEQEQSKCLVLAASLIQDTIKKSETKYNLIQPGIVLPHARKYWSLSKCGICGAKGRIECSTCSGRCEETCWRCYGSKYIACDGYGCVGGQVNCIYCSGSGQVSQSESYQESFWNGSNTEYRTAYRTVSVRCTAFGCMFGKTQCIKCQGIAQIGCYTCSRSGKITCRTCSGLGDITCGVCAGSTESGIASWVDVNVKSSYDLNLLDAPDESSAAASKEGVDGLPLISQVFDYRSSNIEGTPPHTISAHYDGQFELIKLNVSCGGNPFKLVAYGSDLRWLSFDGVIEHLVESDLSLLEKTLLECADDEISETRTDHLLEAIKHVVASEVNSDALNAELNKTNDQTSQLMSQEFSARINRCILGSLRHIYLRMAKVFWWKLVLATLVANLLSKVLFGPGWAFVISVVTITLGWFIFNQKVKNQFHTYISHARHAEWLTEIAKKSGRSNLGLWIALSPSVVLLLILCMVKPI